MKVPNVKCVLAATLLLAIVGEPAISDQYAAAPYCAGVERIATYVNGKRLEFASDIVGSGSLPTLLIRGHAMVPARLFEEVFHESIDLHLLHWDIVRIGGLSLKMGDNVACFPVPMVGGSGHAPVPLPLPPVEIDGRIYVPARAVLNAFGHAVWWDREERAICITENGVDVEFWRQGVCDLYGAVIGIEG